jgi:hypothetical protein
VKHKLLIAMTTLMLFGMTATSFGVSPTQASVPSPTPTPSDIVWYDDDLD